jgi:hypothetical protein
MGQPSIARTLRSASGGSTREAQSRESAAAQTALRFPEAYRHHEHVATLRLAFKQAVEEAGGVEWLALTLGKPISYASKISEALNGVEGRHIQFEEWVPPLLSNWRAMEILFTALCSLSHRDVPKAKRIATDAERADALVKVLEKAGKAGAALLQEAAEEMGVDLAGLIR